MGAEVSETTKTVAYSEDVNAIAHHLDRALAIIPAAPEDIASAVAECLLRQFVTLRRVYGEAIPPEMVRFAERVKLLAATKSADEMDALSEHLADAYVPGNVN